MSIFDQALDWIGRRIASRLTHASSGYEPFTHSDPSALARALRPADVLGGGEPQNLDSYQISHTVDLGRMRPSGDALDPTALGTEASAHDRTGLANARFAPP